MKTITLLLEEDEIFILRGQMRMMQLLLPDVAEGGGNPMEELVKKILQATTDVNQDYRKEIAKMQRAMRAIKQTPFYPLLLTTMESLGKMLQQEMEKENENEL